MDQMVELGERVVRLASGARIRDVAPGLAVAAITTPTAPLGNVNRPTVSLVLQGVKHSALGERVYEYRAGQYLAVGVDLPLVSRIVHAGPEQPFLAIGLALDPATVTELLPSRPGRPVRAPDSPAIAVSEADPGLLDAVVRLLRLLEQPADFAVLGPAVRREVHWRLINGPQGAVVAQLGRLDGRLATVTRATRWLQDHYDEPIRIQDLADHVGLSVSSLNRNFRAVTSMSPLQYQKQLRLQQARLLLLTSLQDVTTVGHSVGYDSASQFSREYRRMFGFVPSRTAAVDAVLVER